MKQFQRVFLPALSILFIIAACSSTSEPKSREDVFRALDAATVRWKQFYDNTNPSLKELDERIRRVARSNRKKLLEVFPDGKREYRMVAAKSLQFLPIDRKVLTTLRTALQDSDQKVRENAAVSLAHMRPSWDEFENILESMKKPIRKMARSSSPGERASAYYAMFGLVTSHRDHGLFSLLIEGLKDSAMPVRNEAVRSFQVLRQKEAVMPLVNNTLHDPAELVRLNTIRALSRQGDRRGIPGLIQILEKGDRENPNITRMAVEVLQELTGRRDLETPADWTEWHHLQNALDGNIPDKSVRSLLPKLITLLDERKQTETDMKDALVDALQTLTGNEELTGATDWMEWKKKQEKSGKPYPVTNKRRVVPKLIAVLETRKRNDTDFSETVVDLLRMISNITDRSRMNSPEAWEDWFESRHSFSGQNG